MMDLRPHRLWLALLAAAGFIALVSGPLFSAAAIKQQAGLATLQNRNEQTATALRQLREDIDMAAKLKAEIGDSEAERLLMPVDRLRVAKMLERRAGQSRLSHFSYSLSPERPTRVETIGAGSQQLAESRLNLAADAASDTDIYQFLDAVTQNLPGRLSVTHLTLEKIGDASTEISAANVRMTAEAAWLSNGALPTLAKSSK